MTRWGLSGRPSVPVPRVLGNEEPLKAGTGSHDVMDASRALLPKLPVPQEFLPLTRYQKPSPAEASVRLSEYPTPPPAYRQALGTKPKPCAPEK